MIKSFFLLFFCCYSSVTHRSAYKTTSPPSTQLNKLRKLPGKRKNSVVWHLEGYWRVSWKNCSRSCMEQIWMCGNMSWFFLPVCCGNSNQPVFKQSHYPLLSTPLPACLLLNWKVFISEIKRGFPWQKKKKPEEKLKLRWLNFNASEAINENLKLVVFNQSSTAASVFTDLPMWPRSEPLSL